MRLQSASLPPDVLARSLVSLVCDVREIGSKDGEKVDVVDENWLDWSRFRRQRILENFLKVVWWVELLRIPVKAEKNLNNRPLIGQV